MSVQTKICGITTVEGLEAAIAGGADYIGLVFFPKSPRNIDITQAKQLATMARGKVKIVSLVVDADDEALTRIIEEVAPDVLQLHGHESPDRVAEIKKKFGITVMKAIPIATTTDIRVARDYDGVADIILFDAKPSSAELPGGNGRTFDWVALDGVARTLPFMLSGGLSPENVAEAIARTRTVAVDVSSGVEKAPGVKDPELIRRFLQTAKAAKQT